MANTSLSVWTKAYTESYEYLPPKGAITLHQKVLFALWISATLFWFYRLLRQGKQGSTEVLGSPIRHSKSDAVIAVPPSTTDRPPRPPPVTLNQSLVAVFTIGWILLYYFVCDYLHYFPKAERVYNRDLFVFLVALLFLVAITCTATESGPNTTQGRLLQREQTEEWKGWMQVMFVWYHYFRAAETYNAVRIYIATYVFMTGFGNFSFFWVRGDYSLRRVLKSLFRLNFLVALTVMTVDNQYLLYYICPMHTFWFLTVYAMMRPYQHLNKNTKVMFLKFTMYFISVLLLFDVPGVGKLVFSPFSFVLNFGDPPSLHEWLFRCGLDHYATFAGMLFAYFHPNIERVLHWVNNHRWNYPILASTALLIITPSMGVWYGRVFTLPKYPYNALHPYTSFLPIIAYILLRNALPRLRRTHCAMFTFLGKITLETYISQLHVYLQKNAKSVLVYLPQYPLLNFLLNTIIYLYLSHLLFQSTCVLNEYLFPADRKQLLRNVTYLTLIFAAFYALVGASMAVHAL